LLFEEREKKEYLDLGTDSVTLDDSHWRCCADIM